MFDHELGVFWYMRMSSSKVEQNKLMKYRSLYLYTLKNCILCVIQIFN